MSQFFFQLEKHTLRCTNCVNILQTAGPQASLPGNQVSVRNSHCITFTTLTITLLIKVSHRNTQRHKLKIKNIKLYRKIITVHDFLNISSVQYTLTAVSFLMSEASHILLNHWWQSSVCVCVSVYMMPWRDSWFVFLLNLMENGNRKVSRVWVEFQRSSVDIEWTKKDNFLLISTFFVSTSLVSLTVVQNVWMCQSSGHKRTLSSFSAFFLSTPVKTIDCINKGLLPPSLFQLQGLLTLVKPWKGQLVLSPRQSSYDHVLVCTFCLLFCIPLPSWPLLLSLGQFPLTFSTIWDPSFAMSSIKNEAADLICSLDTCGPFWQTLAKELKLLLP